MTKIKRGLTTGPSGKTKSIRNLWVAVFLAISTVFFGGAGDAQAQNYRFTSVKIEGNKRVEQGTILSYAGIAKGQTVSGGALNSAYQRILGSGLFETVEIEPRGNTLVIKVREFPTINRISFEGNRRIKDDELSGFIESRSRLVYSPTKAERDAATITEAYAQNGRLAARVSPKIIRRSDNRVDLVFEIFEGGLTEVERISFVGNQVFSDRRLRRVLESKQAGVLRVLFKQDTFVADRLEFDKQVLRDFYLSRGYIDFRIQALNAELARERDGYFVTFNVEEGQQFRFGEITTVSEMDEADEVEFHAVQNLKSGAVYAPTRVENAIARMERHAVREGIDFLRVEPRITRNDRDLTLDIEFVLVRGQRIFVERIDIEGNATTLDRVVRQQFRIVEGDPFNPREIRESAERIRALGLFEKADVNAREGSSPDRVVVDVDVEEKSTGSLTFGGAYSSSNGFGLVVKFQEDNFLGRGQKVSLSASGATDNKVYGFGFVEPAFLGRDVEFHFDASYRETEGFNSLYDTEMFSLTTGLEFPISERARFGVNYKAGQSNITKYTGNGLILANEAARSAWTTSSIGYNLTYDTRRTGLDPNKGVFVRFGQDFGGVGGDGTFVRTGGKIVAQTRVFNEEITLRASLAGGALVYSDGQSSLVTERFLFSDEIIRGFAPDGIGPREYNAVTGANDALGGNMFVTARFEAQFPIGLPEEYGITGGLFYDIGSVWGLDTVNSDVLYEGGSMRHVAGISIFWKTPFGPLRMNWSNALKKEQYDEEQEFELTISTQF
ncbi:MAG: outer membrane protein assembly factor BamA [Rhodobacterales bacterium]|nr:MAG: outer membrane protein assembly factor BamA [Rhodobacterales bacterium]